MVVDTPPAKLIVLVVEDEPLLLMLAVGIVEDAGFEALTAVNADDAIDLLVKRTDVRIVFTDIDMPGSMDGMKLAAAVRDRWPPIEIIITSGLCVPAKADMPARGHFFPKPYNADRVTAMLHKMA